MPFVRLTAESGFVPSTKRTDLLSSVHEAVMAVEGEAMRTGIGVVLDEVPATLNVALFIEIVVIRDALTEDQRQQMLTTVVEAAVRILGEETRMGIWGIVSE